MTMAAIGALTLPKTTSKSFSISGAQITLPLTTTKTKLHYSCITARQGLTWTGLWERGDLTAVLPAWACRAGRPVRAEQGRGGLLHGPI